MRWFRREAATSPRYSKMFLEYVRIIAILFAFVAAFILAAIPMFCKHKRWEDMPWGEDDRFPDVYCLDCERFISRDEVAK